MSGTTTVNVDVEQIVTGLQQKLGTLPSWKDLLTAATGTALIELIATAAGFSIYANERAFLEAFPDTAILPSSITSSIRLLGVRISRKLPASGTFNITKPADGIAAVIPAYTQFSYPGGMLFNRTAILFSNTEVTQTVSLYEGRLVTVYLQGLGTDFQTFISADSGFTVSDADVAVLLNGTPIPVVVDGLWRYAAQTFTNAQGVMSTVTNPAVQDRTNKDGALELNFGSTYYGTQPQIGDSIQVTYAVTQGQAGNNTNFAGTPISLTPYYTVVATSALTGGADEKNPTVYQRIGPPAFASLVGAVNSSGYNAVATSYPGVIDAQVWGQSLVAPTRPDYMNVLRISLLTSSPWGSGQLADFQSWYEQRTMSYMNFWFVPPVPFNYQITANIYCNATVDLNTVQAQVITALTNLTTPTYGSIGRTVYLSDIYEAIANANSGILYSQVLSPNSDLITRPKLYNLTGSVTVSGGSIPSGSIEYEITAVSVVNGVNVESLGTPLGITVAANQALASITLNWTKVQGAIAGWNIYSTLGGVNLGLIASLPASATSFVDTGITPSATIFPPTVDGFPVLYPNCTGIQLNMFYASDRGVGQT